ncbi:MAG: dihydroxyacetone kinase subunit DhaL [Pyramidobacter sp.]|nr:dihydroxyacetone kinase subunit DhaL [Pyramidobacter sp.]
MALSGCDWQKMIIHASKVLKDNAAALSQLDSEIGDGDHGVTIGMIAGEMDKAAQAWDCVSLKSFFDDLGWKAMGVNGGSAGSLWGSFFQGVSEALNDEPEMTSELLKKALRAGLDGIRCVSKAQVGDKTMMDALIPAVEAAEVSDGEPADVLLAAARAARAGSDKTAEFIAKYGRAKNLKEGSLGHKDPGSVSFALLLESLADAAQK